MTISNTAWIAAVEKVGLSRNAEGTEYSPEVGDFACLVAMMERLVLRLDSYQWQTFIADARAYGLTNAIVAAVLESL